MSQHDVNTPASESKESSFVLHYITDQREGEPDILTPVKNSRLTILSLDGQMIHCQEAPDNGWTHFLLCEVQPKGMEDGANAWLDDVWVGSTEV